MKNRKSTLATELIAQARQSRVRWMIAFTAAVTILAVQLMRNGKEIFK